MKCCIYCFTNKFIKAAIMEQDEVDVCSYCNMDGHEEAYVSELDIIGDLIREKLGLAYTNATTDDVPYHVLRGLANSIEDVLRYEEDIFSVDLDDTGNIPGLIQDLFSSSGPSYREIAQGDDDEWDGGNAEIIKIDEFYVDSDNNHFRYQWDEFKYLVKHVNRFFDIGGSREEMLETFKEFLKQMESTLPIGTLIWRARSNPDQISSQLNDMQEVCGPPPRNISKSFRMNPAGITYFYGSVDKSTCKEEIRPQNDDKIVYGHFATKKELRIVDLSVAPSIYAKSIFDPEYDHDLNWASIFLDGFVNEISKPIEEKLAPIEYVPTQILSEYIRKLGYDGLCFRSCFTGKLNYTLFCGKEEESEPGDSEGLGWKFSQMNQVPEFTEWLELVKLDIE